MLGWDRVGERVPDSSADFQCPSFGISAPRSFTRNRLSSLVCRNLPVLYKVLTKPNAGTPSVCHFFSCLRILVVNPIAHMLGGEEAIKHSLRGDEGGFKVHANQITRHFSRGLRDTAYVMYNACLTQ